MEQSSCLDVSEYALLIRHLSQGAAMLDLQTNSVMKLPEMGVRANIHVFRAFKTFLKAEGCVETGCSHL